MSKKWIENKKTRTKKGYVLVKDHGILQCPYAWQDGRVYEHALVIWKAGIPYDPSFEVIHHKNGNRSDNRLENLEVIHKDAHSMFSLFNY